MAADDYFQVQLGWVLTDDRRMKCKPLPDTQSCRLALARRCGPSLGRILTLTDHELEPPFAFGLEISLKCDEVTMFLPKEK